jgi:hypothetical protein
MLAGNEVCWCFSERVGVAALEKIPLEARDAACICRTCALGNTSATRLFYAGLAWGPYGHAVPTRKPTNA